MYSPLYLMQKDQDSWVGATGSADHKPFVSIVFGEKPIQRRRSRDIWHAKAILCMWSVRLNFAECVTLRVGDAFHHDGSFKWDVSWLMLVLLNILPTVVWCDRHMSSTTLQMPAITSEQPIETLPSLFGPFTVLSVGSEPNLAQQSLDLGSPFHGRGLGFHRYSRWLFTYRMNSLNREHLLTNNTLLSQILLLT